ncbi:MAG TPA: MXAN_6640 family putative metalloprotease, partial [Solirubrobacterales bacterium]
MRAPRHLIGASLACLLLCAAPPALASAAQKPFEAPLARPTDHRPTSRNAPNRSAYTVPQAPKSPFCAKNFCVHWVSVGVDAPNAADANGISDGDGIPDYVEHVIAVAEHVYSIENGKLGWRDPKSDGTEGGGNGKTDIYLANIGGELFGYAAPDRGQASKAHRIPRRLHGYLVIDNDYAPSEFPGTTQTDDLEVTLAHEYNHILQFGYDAYQDAWFAESTATWMEDQVYNGINDYLRYVPRWTQRFDTPLTTSSIKEYGSAVWNHWLSHRYGQAIMRSAWARAIHTKPGGFAIGAYESAIHAAGGPGFSRDFAAFARDVTEWRTDSVFPEGSLYPDAPRQGNLSVDGASRVRDLNHTTFQLIRVGDRTGKAVTVSATAPRGISSAVALVGRIGSERHGRVISRMNYRQGGGPM